MFAKRMRGKSLIFAGFLAWGLLKASAGLFSPGESFFHPQGDGLGGLGSLYSVGESFREHGAGVLWGDHFHLEHQLFGLRAASPFSVFWKTYHGLLSQVLTPVQIYELTALFGFAAIGFLGVLLGTEVGLSLGWALAFGAGLCQLEIFTQRLVFHLFGLGVYVGPILLAVAWVRALKSEQLWPWILAGLATTLNFLLNEYYGYFGLFFSTAFVVAGLWPKVRTWKAAKTFAKPVAASVAAFVVSMALAYPNLVGAKIFGGASKPGTYVKREFGDWDFNYYAMNRPLSIFRSGFSEVREVLRNTTYRFEEDGFRIGLLFPLLGFGLWYFLRRQKKPRGMAPWLWATLICALVAMSPIYWLALSRVTQRIAPQFRVGARAYIYVDLSLLLCFFLMAQTAWEKLKKNGTVVQRRALIAACGIALIDMQGLNTFKPWKTFTIPDVQGYDKISGPGLLLELPVLEPTVIEPHYRYESNRRIHGQDIANGSYPVPENTKYQAHLSAFAKAANCLKPELLKRMRQAGLTTLVVNQAYGCDSKWVASQSGVRVLYQGPERTIYAMDQIAGAKLDFKKDIWGITD